MNFLTIVSLFCSGTAAIQGNSLLPNVRARYIEESGFDSRAPIVGYTYSSYKNNNPYFATFGTATRVEAKEVGKTSKVVRQGWWVWDQTKKDFPTKAYAVYKYSYRADSGTNLMSKDAIYLSNGLDMHFTWTVVKGQTDIFSSSLTTTMTTKFGMKEKAQVSGDIYGVKVGGEVSSTQEISNSISASITKTASYTYEESTLLTYDFHSSESSYYRFQERATFDVYCVQSYTINYTKTQTTTYDNGYRNYRYTYNPSYVLDEQIIKFTYVEESAAIGVYKQKVNSDGSKTYDDVKLENTVYF